eukprot:3159003-Prymnesium_polylepis.1
MSYGFGVNRYRHYPSFHSIGAPIRSRTPDPRTLIHRTPRLHICARLARRALVGIDHSCTMDTCPLVHDASKIEAQAHG